MATKTTPDAGPVELRNKRKAEKADAVGELAKRLAHAVRWGSAEDRAALCGEIDEACGVIPPPGVKGDD